MNQSIRDAEILLERTRREYIERRAAAVSTTPRTDAKKLWLWRNFVDGRPEYWAFDNAFPTFDGGDPMVIGEPCGYALLLESTPSPRRISTTDAEVIAAIRLSRGYDELERENAELQEKLVRAQKILLDVCEEKKSPAEIRSAAHAAIREAKESSRG